LNDLYNKSLKEKSQLTAFVSDTSKHETLDIPLQIENSFIIAPKNGIIITDWFNEFNKAVLVGFSVYKKYIINNGVNISKIGLGYPDKENEVYLTCFAALNKCLQKNISPLPPTIFEIGDDSIFKLHSQCKWNNHCVMNTIKNDKNVRDIPYIKLIGMDRKTNIDISEYFRDEKK
jgi:hypothetical protein